MHIEIKTGYGYALALLVGMPLLLPGTLEAADNLNFRGVLVADACTLRPGDEAVELNLRDVSVLVHTGKNCLSSLVFLTP